MITLIHPTRGRAAKSAKTVNNWLQKAANEVEVLVSIDADDPEKSNYLHYHKGREVFINQNTSVVEATNVVCPYAAGDLLLYLSDDFDCPDYWDVMIESEFKGVDGPCLLKVDDCLQPFDNTVLTIPIMNKALYNKLNYFWHPDYKSMFVDVDLFFTCKDYIKYAPTLKFPHLHHSLGHCENDATYKNSEKNWKSGEIIYKRRQAEGFSI